MFAHPLTQDNFEKIKREKDEEKRGRLAAEKRADEEKRGRLAAEKRAEAAEKRAEASEKRAEAAEKKSAPQSLFQFLWTFHLLFLKMKVITDKWWTTSGTVSDPKDRYYPEKFVRSLAPARPKGLNIWDGDLKKDIAKKLNMKSSMELAVLIEPMNLIGSEVQLVNFLINIINYPLMEAIKSLCEMTDFKGKLGLSGKIWFQEHTNLGKEFANNTKGNFADGKTEQADDYLVHKLGEAVQLILCAEYKPPHKLPLKDIEKGLETGVINLRKTDLDSQMTEQDDQDDQDHKEPITLVLVQLYSTMMKRRIRHGYVCTGEAIVFLWLDDDDDDAGTVKYRLSVPKTECSNETEVEPSEVQQTALGQILDFFFQAVKAGQKGDEWWEETLKGIPTWTAEKKAEKADKGDKLYSGVKTNPPRGPHRMKTRSQSQK